MAEKNRDVLHPPVETSESARCTGQWGLIGKGAGGATAAAQERRRPGGGAGSSRTVREGVPGGFLPELQINTLSQLLSGKAEESGREEGRAAQ